MELQSLLPDTYYEFNIGEGIENASEVWRFRTMPRDLKRSVHFVTGGDRMHTRQKLDKATGSAAALDPDFALLMGDLAYANGVGGMVEELDGASGDPARAVDSHGRGDRQP